MARIKYYLDGVLQDKVPELPDTETEIELGDTAIIGHPDKIQSRNGHFRVHRNIIEP